MENDYCSVPLSQGKTATVSPEDYEFLMQWKWCAFKAKKICGDIWYAMRKSQSPKRKSIYMHRVVAIRAGLPECPRYDHANHDTLDNRRSNIRDCTASQSSANRRKPVTSSRPFKGVYAKHNRWQARVGKRYLGSFKDPIDAAVAYNTAAAEIWGQFAWLNPIPTTQRTVQ